MTVCKQVRYSGQVQGVGFRYTAQRLAEGYAVSGYVRNLPEGDVELVAEYRGPTGGAGELDAGTLRLVKKGPARAVVAPKAVERRETGGERLAE